MYYPLASKYFSTNPSYNKKERTITKLANPSFKLGLKKANSFFKETLRDSSITSTYILGKEVYNIRDRASNRVIGYLGYLVSLDKLTSLINFIARKALEANNNSFIILLDFKLENKYYYLIYNKGTIVKEEFISSKVDFRREFTKYKNSFLNKSL